MTQIGSNGLPAIEPTALPADVREGSAERQERFKAALAFERVLVGQLTEKLFAGASPEGGSAAVNIRRQQLPGALADSLIATGGLGIARQLDASWSTGEKPVETSLSESTDEA